MAIIFSVRICMYASQLFHCTNAYSACRLETIGGRDCGNAPRADFTTGVYVFDGHLSSEGRGVRRIAHVSDHSDVLPAVSGEQ